MESPAAVSSRLIGAIFVEKGLITPEQLERAMQIQEATGDRLGEVIVAEFGVARLELASVLAEQWAEFERTEQPQDAPAPSAEPLANANGTSEPLLRRPIGEIFVERGFISADQLQAAVDVQATTGQRIGEILVEQGSLSRLDLASALAEQWSSLQKLRPPDPTPLEPGRADIVLPAPASDASALADLESRVRMVERAAAASPSESDLQALSTELRNDLAALALTLERADGAGAQLEPLEAALAELRGRVDAPLARLAEVERHLASMVTADVLDERLLAVDRVAARIDELAQRAPQVGDLDEVRSRLDDLAERVEQTAAELQREVAESAAREPVQARDADAAARVEGLATQLDALTAQLDGLAAQVAAITTAPAWEPYEGVQAELGALAGQVAALAGRGPDEATESRLTELAGRIEAVAAAAVGPGASEDLSARIAELAGRIEDAERLSEARIDDGLRAEIAGLANRVDDVLARSTFDTAALAARVDALEGAPAEVTSEDIAALTRSLAEQQARLEATQAEHPSERADDGELDALRVRVDELDALRTRIDELAGGAGAAEVRELGERIGALESRLADTAPVQELRDEVQRVAESAAGERASLERALLARVDAITTKVPAVDEFSELRSRVEELAARPGIHESLETHVAELATRLDAAAAAGDAVESLRQAFADLNAAREEDARSTAERLGGLEAAVAAVDGLAGLEERLRNLVAESDSALVERLDDAHRKLGGIPALEGRIDELRAELASRDDGSALAAAETRLTHELAGLAQRVERQEHELAGRPQRVDEAARIDSIGVRVDVNARDMHDRVSGLAAELGVRIEDLSARLHGLDEVSKSLAGRDEIAAAADRVQALEERLQALAEQGAVDAALDRVAAIESSVADGFGQLESMRRRAAAQLDEAVGTLRAETESQESRTVERLAEHEARQLARQDEVARQLGELHERTAGRDEWQAALESRVETQIAELAARLAAETERLQAAAAASVESAQGAAAAVGDALREEIETSRQALHLDLEKNFDAARLEAHSLAMRIDELHALRHADAGTARAAVEAVEARMEEIDDARGQDADAAKAASAETGAKLEKLAVTLRREAAAARDAAVGVGGRLDELTALRADDAEAAQAVAAELVARLDDLALRSAAAAADSERALRDEIGGVAARFEEQDAAGIEAREELRGEVERVASSVGWRLERIEESLASDDTEALRAAVAEVQTRLDAQLSQQDEQVRVTERALRKGLASLGERLAENESSYLEAGTTLRRSIERLGAAVVEADARMADQIPVAEVEGYVAFAPTAEGYRLVQVPGRPPEVGAQVDVAGCEGPLVVTRYGRSPLPLDSRACAYLDRP